MMAATAYSVALLGGARLPAAPRSAALPRRSACQLRLQDAPRLSLLRVKAASEDTSASADELIEDLKAKVRRVLPTVPCAPPRRGIHGREAM